MLPALCLLAVTSENTKPLIKYKGQLDNKWEENDQKPPNGNKTKSEAGLDIKKGCTSCACHFWSRTCVATFQRLKCSHKSSEKLSTSRHNVADQSR